MNHKYHLNFNHFLFLLITGNPISNSEKNFFEIDNWIMLSRHQTEEGIQALPYNGMNCDLRMRSNMTVNM